MWKDFESKPEMFLFTRFIHITVIVRYRVVTLELLLPDTEVIRLFTARRHTSRRVWTVHEVWSSLSGLTASENFANVGLCG